MALGAPPGPVSTRLLGSIVSICIYDVSSSVDLMSGRGQGRAAAKFDFRRPLIPLPFLTPRGFLFHILYATWMYVFLFVLVSIWEGCSTKAKAKHDDIIGVLPALWGPHVVCPGHSLHPFYGIYIHKAV